MEALANGFTWVAGSRILAGYLSAANVWYLPGLKVPFLKVAENFVAKKTWVYLPRCRDTGPL